jgi:hypothetical protein
VVYRLVLLTKRNEANRSLGKTWTGRPSRQSPPGRPASGWFIVRGVEHDATVEAFAIAFRTEVGLIAQGEMNDTALARRHGSEVIGRASFAHLFGGNGGRHAQLLHANGALVLAIEGNLFVLSGRQAQDFEGKQFEGAEKFGTAVEQQRRIGAGEVHENLGLLPFALRRRIDNDAVLEVKSAVGDDGLEEFVDFVSGGEFVHRAAFSHQPSAFAWLMHNSRVFALRETCATSTLELLREYNLHKLTADS